MAAIQFISVERAIEILPDGAVVVNEEGKLVGVNQQAALLFGYDQHFLKDQPLEVLLPLRYRERHTGHVRHFFEAPSVRKMGKGLALFGLRKDGTEIDVDIALSPIVIDGKRLVLAVIRDVTELKQLERQLVQKNEQLRVINEQLERFGYTISHDLKSPLANIHAILHLLTRELPAEQRQQLDEYLLHLNQTLHAMANLITGVAAYSRAGIEEAEEQVSLADILDEVQKLVLLPDWFRIEVVGKLPELYGNRTKVLQVFLNLVTNAVKYNDKPEGLVQIFATENSRYCIICVEDNGPGIPAEKRQCVFDLFEKGDSHHADSQGIGLSIVKKIVEDRGGLIKAGESKLGGARFTLIWPVAPSAANGNYSANTNAGQETTVDNLPTGKHP